jgi:2-polyprenyl-6-methoxyphenol hydroxylase-like FAD-dependent oxidoreductase
LGKQSRKRAVVLGGSMSGLFAARVLTEAYHTVTVVDRDELTGVSQPRRGVPQGRQVHGLLSSGHAVIEELFPGVTDEMVRAGAHIGDLAGNLRWLLNGIQLAQSHSGLTALTSSRPFLERHVRARVQALPGVEFLERTDVLRLRTSEDHRRVTGVWVAGREKGSAEQVLDADLVLDATGRGSRTPGWLMELGYPRADEEKLTIGLGYTTRHYKMRSDPFGTDTAINTMATPRNPRGAICAKVDGDRTVVTAYGTFGDHPPTDPEGFLAFIRSVSAPDIYDALQDAEPLDDPVGYRFPVNLRRRYDRLPRFPDGLLVIGDAVCSLNPSYAQGMTVAALEATTLRHHLRQGAPIDPLAYFRDLSTYAIDRAWDLMAGGDPGVDDVGPTRTERFRHAYVTRVERAATRDAEVAQAYLRVIALVEPAESLIRPSLVLRVLRNTLGAPYSSLRAHRKTLIQEGPRTS